MKGYTMSSLEADINPEQEGSAMWGRQPHKPVPRRMWWVGMGGGQDGGWHLLGVSFGCLSNVTGGSVTCGSLNGHKGEVQ